VVFPCWSNGFPMIFAWLSNGFPWLSHVILMVSNGFLMCSMIFSWVCNVMLCYAMLWHGMLCHAMSCHVMSCHVMSMVV